MEPPTNNNSSNFDLNASPPCFLQSSTNSMQQTNVAQKIQVFPQTQVCDEQSCLKQVGQHSNVLQQVSSQQVSSQQISSQQVSNEECLEDDDVFCDSSSTCCVEPEQRARSYTWPQNISGINKQINQQHFNCIPNIPSTSSLVEEENVSCCNSHSSLTSLLKLKQQPELNSNFIVSCSSISEFSQQQQQRKIKPKRIRRKTNENENFHQLPTDYGRKPNPWGNESYSDLIARALNTAPEGRLKLNEIYQWFSENVPYFAGRSSQEDAQGWKNSIRHNLSLHSRFMRIQNEGAGKSSWWVINPDAKPGRNPRRRANTMENSSKTAMDRKRRGTARKRVEHLNKDIKHEDCYSMEAASLQDLSYPNDICHEEMPCGTNAEMVGGGVCVVGEGPICGGGGGVAGSVNNNFMFRPRANSTLSVTGGNTRFSPNLETSACIEDIDFPPWMEQQQMEGQQQQILNPQVSELLDRTGQMRLDGRRPMRPTFQRNGNGALIRVNNKRHSSLIPLATSPQNNPLVVPKTEIDVEQKIIKQEAIAPPPSYQELSAVRGSLPQQMQNPLLLRMGEHQQQQMMTPMKMNSIPSSTSVASQSFPVSIFTSTNGQQQMFSPDNNNFQQWNRQPPNTFPQHINPMASNNGQIMFPGGGIIGGENNNNNGTSLPFDLESVNAMPVDQQAFADLDVDAVLRHELAQGGQFDLP